MATTPIVVFRDTPTLIQFAEDFINNRLKSLEYDVSRCLRKENNGYSPFPALMYCLSVIDLMGALYAGRADNKRNPTANSLAYLENFFNYDKDKRNLLWKDLFRHKLIHLSMPQTALNFKGDIVSWNLHDENPSNHMCLTNEQGTLDIKSNDGTVHGSIKYNKKLVINIEMLKNDIVESVKKYFKKLKSDPDIRRNFKKAINDIYVIGVYK